jgi:hypothetical protein
MFRRGTSVLNNQQLTELAEMFRSLELVSILHQVDGSEATLHVRSLICLVCGIYLSFSLTVSQIACVV